MSEHADPAIEVKNIIKSFRIPVDKSRSVKSKLLGKVNKGHQEFTPLNGISFTINKGEFFGIVGRNGSGKSTLLKTIAGIYSPTKGRVVIDGTLVPFIELGVGFNPQLSGKDNVYLNGALLGFSREEIDGMYDDIVEFAELHDFMEERLQNYSSGMQVRLAFSISIRAKGDILLLDEVLAVGDAAFQRKCYDYFEQLKKEKKTVVLVSHSMVNVERFCTRALLLEEGEVKYIGSSVEATERYLDLLDSAKEPAKLSLSDKHSAVGSVKVELTNVSVLQNGDETDAVIANEPFLVSVLLEAKQNMYNLNTTIRIRDIRENVVFAQDSYGITLKRIDIDEKSFIRVDFTIDNYFSDGVYQIGIMTKASDSDENREIVIDEQGVARFKVNGPKRSVRSIFYPPVKVSVKKETRKSN